MHREGAPHRPVGTRWYCDQAVAEQYGKCDDCYNGTPNGARYCEQCAPRHARYLPGGDPL